jgi:membrane protease YdiL (CAAX protease family)
MSIPRNPQRISLPQNRLAALQAAVVVRAYLSAIAAAEGMAIFVGPVAGVVCHALLIPMLLSHYMWEETRTYRRILPILALAPLLRLLSFAMPIRDLPPIFWYGLIGVPLLLAALLTARRLGYSAAQVGLQLRAPLAQLVIAFTGLPLSLLAFYLLRPEPVVPDANIPLLISGVILLTFFTGFLEEFIFRGLLQYAVTDIFGTAGLFYSVALFTVLYLATLSLSYILFMGLLAIFFSWCVHKTGSIWGVVVAHSIFSIGFLLIWPLVVLQS